MRKSHGILICILCSIFCVLTQAQPRLNTPEFYLGAHGGVTTSTVLFNPAKAGMSPITSACVLGGNGGFVFRYAGHKYCHFQMELTSPQEEMLTYKYPLLTSETIPLTVLLKEQVSSAIGLVKPVSRNMK